ncbi:hypothetical protein UCRPA7_646 [Phaeoacremonium minimum UCRPA7]|uniref:Uncharacterized protein n=1 Tax=Phaeoacremonium minimum (strain UCR-PA7) TaxID=1286976 RepID=R8BXB7_PHAM7|nr:hypothetical protein UCRPA7_646 [Phaeoacremonium minimum UCRPA7]EOO03924.1 hypothetical protein UCRPA7_646 [Phaeoacremonium minimum UCRPA7]
MTSIESRIQAAAARNKELLSVLSETDHALPDLEQQRRYIADLESQVNAAAKRLAEIDKKRKKELKEHESYRDSVMKRFAYKVGGKSEKFAARAEKEEREYFDVLQEEHRETEMKKNVETMLQDAKTVRTQLEMAVSRHSAAQSELDSLYDSIFQGPTPGFPEEDQKERESNAALQAYHDARTRAEGQGQAVKTLGYAQQRINGALMSMDDALRYSRRDMFGGGTLTDMMERNALHQAETQVQEARMLVMQAQRMSEHVQPLPPVQIAQGSLMTDVFFDNIFTDMAFHDKIKASNLEVQRCADNLARQLASARSRHMDLSWELDRRAAALEESRVNLQKARQAAFERITGPAQTGGADGEGPPPPAVPPKDVPPKDAPPAYEPPPGPPPSSSTGENWWEQ